MRILRLVLVGLLMLSPVGAIAAEKVAVIIVNEQYTKLNRVTNAGDVVQTAKRFRDAGYETHLIRNVSSKSFKTNMTQIARVTRPAKQVVIVAAGHIVTAGGDSYLLNVDAPQMNVLFTASNGTPINGLEAIAGSKPGGSILALGNFGRPPKMGYLTVQGYNPESIPQGVTVFYAPMSWLAPLINQQILKGGTTTADMVKNAPNNVRSYGFLTDVFAFDQTAMAVEAQDDTENERTAWLRARNSGTAEAMENFLRQHPNGAFAVIAESLLKELSQSPQQIAAETEASLNLSRSARSNIQRDLSLLGYNTRGIDGIFGRGTRAAVQGWQKDRRFEETGYFTANQVAALTSQAQQRAAELAEEARERQEDLERADLSYWRQTGRLDTEEGLRAYLKRYPDGLYSDIALDRVEIYDARKRERAAIAEARDWDAALNEGTEAGFSAFLRKYPNGTFAADAREKIADMRDANQSSEAVRIAAAQEKRVLGNSAARLIVERKLDSLGLKPGLVDGKFDASTRRAVRRFQDNTGLPVTGYVTQITMVRLLVSK